MLAAPAPVKKQIDADFPFVSVVTPTYNRRTFIPVLLKCFAAQTYPKARMEWIVLDDGYDGVEDLFIAAKAAGQLPEKFKYIRGTEKLNIGAKRNWLNREATGDIIIAMDDDDYYPSDRISHVVSMFKRNPTVELAGSTEIYMYYTDIKTIYKLGPYNKNHATNGTMAWRRSYALTRTYDETVTHAEEKSFLENYRNPMIQLNPKKVMLVIAHSENTFNKKKMREDLNNPTIRKTELKLKNFVGEAALREFYNSLA